MFKNHLKIAIRNLLKHRVFSAVNILGLALGVSACLTIFNYLRFENSYDEFHANRDRIYRVPMEIIEKGGATQTFAFTYPPVGPFMKDEFPEVKEFVRWRRQGGNIQVGDQVFSESRNIYFVDQSVFKVFDFPFVAGNPQNALSELNNVVITTPAAKKYFGNIDPIGQSLTYRNEEFIVTAILEDIPETSHIDFDFLFSFEKYVQIAEGQGANVRTNWNWSDYYTYVLLEPNVDPTVLEIKFPAFAQRHKGEDMDERGYEVQFNLQPLEEIHLKSKYDYEFAGNGNFKYLDFLALAGLIILFIAWLNYVNLSTARSLDRSKEVGIRKVVGAFRYQLMRQFLVESLLVNIIAIGIGIAIFHFAQPFFRELVGKNLPGITENHWTFWATLGGLFIVGSLISGFYPAFIMSAFRPIQVLKGSSFFQPGKNGNAMLRKVMVVVQFAAAIMLIAGVFGLNRQMEFMRQRDLGINIEQTYIIQETMPRDSLQLLQIQSFLDELENRSEIEKATASTDIPGKEVGGSTIFKRKNAEDDKRCRVFGIDEEFVPNYGLQMAAGRNFSDDFGAEETNILINEATARVLGFSSSEEAVNQEVSQDGDLYTVVGVVKDYHQESLQYDFDPIVFYFNPGNWNYYSLKLNTTDMLGTLAIIENTWKDYFPGNPYQAFFLDEFYEAQYKAEQQFSAILWIFTFLAITVACLGLLGLSIFTLSKKAKEISVRKVLGASVQQIVTLVTSEYVKLILLAGIIAIPVAYLLMNRWLTTYAFRIQIGWWFFVLPVVTILFIALIAIGWQSIRAAQANPANNLRSE